MLSDEVMMATFALAPTSTDRYPRIATPLHTMIVLALVGGWAIQAKILTSNFSGSSYSPRLHIYAMTICMEWFLFAVVLMGVRRSGSPLSLVLGERWRSVGQILRDLGIAIVFWFVALVVLWTVGKLLPHAAPVRNLQFLLPRRRPEIITWIALSLTAGICEETVFRGYLQRQFMALAKNAPTGILLSAGVFGAAHIYQGFRGAILIGIFGALFGILAYWRGTVRPGMLAHTWHDSITGIVVGSMKR